MAKHTATVCWKREDNRLADGGISRGHEWTFDGGAVVKASSSPSVLKEPYSIAAYVDPEEALLAAAASCHMLFFLHFAEAEGVRVAEYEDRCEARLARDAEGKAAITQIRLNPRVAFDGEAPAADDVAALHEKSHDACFIANSLKTPIEVCPR